MRILRVLLTTAMFAGVGACAARGPELHQPVGSSSAGSTRAPPPDTAGRGDDAGASAAEAPPPARVDADPEAETADVCAMDTIPAIHFDYASSEMGESQTRELQGVARCLTAAPYETSSIVLIGYTDVVGAAPANLTLGLARARAVMQRLISAGISPGRMVIASAGELQRPSARLGLRADRVELFIAQGGTARPNEVPIVRGIPAEGLIRRPAPSGGSPSPPPRTPSPNPPASMRRPPPQGAAPPRPK